MTSPGPARPVTLDDALRARESRLAAIFAQAPVGLSELDAAGRFHLVNDEMCRILGRPREALLALRVVDVTSPDDVVPSLRALAAVQATGGGAALDKRYLRPDGSLVWTNSSIVPLPDTRDTAGHVLVVTIDLTARQLAAQMADRERAQGERDLLRRELAAAEEDERRRLARELHDQLGQHLTAFGLLLEETQRLVPAEQAAQRRLAQLRELADMMARDARYLALELRPPELDDVGLSSALETYVEQWRGRYGTAAEVAVGGLAARGGVPAEVATAVYRIVQEALTNVARHAEARHVTVLLDAFDDELRLIVEDDGRGFEVEPTVARTRRERRLGLAGMRERAVLAGGTLEIESAPGVGTTLYVRIPMGRR